MGYAEVYPNEPIRYGGDMPPNVLVIGGTGFIGLHFVKRLTEQGYPTTVLSRTPLNYLPLPLSKAEYHAGAITDATLLEKLVADQDWIFNLTGIVDRKNTEGIAQQSLEVNAQGELNVLETIRKINPAARHVFIGTRAQFGKTHTTKLITEDFPQHPNSFYAIHKQTAELYTEYYSKVYKLHTTVLRPVSVYGHDLLNRGKGGVIDLFVRRCMQNQPVTIFNDGTDIKDFIHVQDLVDVFMTVMNKNTSGVYNIGTGKGARFIDIVQKIVKICGGGEVQFKQLSPEEDYFELDHFVPDISKIKKATGWTPKITLENGISRLKRCYENQVII